MAALNEEASCFWLLIEEPSVLSDGRQQDDEQNDEHIAQDC
jgi:hypothetical protein